MVNPGIRDFSTGGKELALSCSWHHIWFPNRVTGNSLTEKSKQTLSTVRYAFSKKLIQGQEL